MAAGNPEARDGLLSIGQVVALLSPHYPDVTPSSLRFLERAGVVEPRHTPGGHRLFAPADVERVRRVKEWQRERLSLAEIRRRLAAAGNLPAPPELAATFLDHCLAGQPAAARRTVLQACEVGLPLARIYDEVLRPALHEVGRRWEAGQLAVGQEHEAAALARDLVAELAARTPEGSRLRQVAVAACVPGEAHDLGLRMAASVFQARGYAVHYLGADVPVESLLHAMRTRGASLLLISATLDRSFSALDTTLREVGTLAEAVRPRVLAGGQAVRARDEMVRRWGATPVHELAGELPL